jgi:hypothetical protein
MDTASPAQGGQGTMVVQAVCAANQVATGGGFDITGTDSTKDVVFSSMPVKVNGSLAPNAWQAKATYVGGGSNNSTLKAFVLCGPAA